VESVLPSDDTIIEIDNKSLTHRPDLWGHYGFARELAAIFGRPLARYAVADLAAYDALPAVDIAVDDTDGCPLYSAMRVEVRDNPASPLRIQSRLLTLGSTPISLLVDVTNYVQLDLGQPTHAFDAAVFSRVRVGRAGAASEFVTLDGKARQLVPDDLLIYGDDVPVALAGVMGGLASGVRPDVRAVVLESANFRASRVRRTSVRLALRTDASLRFEKKLPPVFARLAAARILRELETAGVAPRPTTRYSYVGDFRDQPRRIVVAPGWFARRAGAAIDDDDALGILRGIGFGAERGADGSLLVDAPAFRSVADVSTPEDLSEEVMRLYGYENITPIPPSGPLAPVPLNAANRSHHRARRVLSEGHGFVEVQTYGWFAGDWLARIGYTPPDPLLVRNPIATTRGVMRTSLVPNLLAAANQNNRVRERFRIHELGKVFWVDNAGQKREENHLAGVVAVQDEADASGTFRAVRGALEDVAAAADRPPLRSGAVRGVAGQPWAVDGHTVELLMGSEVVGHMGVLPRELLQKVLAGGHAVWFSVRMQPFEGEPFPSLPYVPPPTFPGSWQDFTFEWPVADGYARLEALLDRFVHSSVESRSLVALYQPPRSPSARYSFRYALRWPDRTPSAADLEGFRTAFLQFAGENRLVMA
jgi:phenylalanyl-tRNA synthetase beta chain